MPSIVMPKAAPKDAQAKDPSIRSKLGPFLNKLATSDTGSGLHVEPIAGTADPRVRTARVDSFYRAVLFQIDQGEDRIYVLHGIWAHDDAITEAKRVTLKVNPRNGTTEVTRVSQAVLDSQEEVERAERQARERLAAAQRQAREIADQAARLEADNARTQDQLGLPGHAAGAGTGAQPGGPGAPAVPPAPAAAAQGGATRPAGAPPAATGAITVEPRDPHPHWPTGLSARVLHEELGLDPSLAAAALAAERESQLLDLAATAEVPWHGDALLSLATGATLEEVREDYELTRPQEQTAPERPDEDAALVAGLRTRAARSAFTWVESDEDLRRAIEGLSFQQWQLFLHPRQRELVERRTKGPMRISGGAGTGKTVIAVHRAKQLAARDAQEGREVSVLLTTFTRNLADDLQRQLTRLDPALPLATGLGEPGVMVSGLDSLALAILRDAGEDIAPVAYEVLGLERPRVLSNAPGQVWREVLAMAGDVLPEPLHSEDFLASEYEMVILPQRITTLQAYLRVRRPGRGVALDRRKRAAVWKVIEIYRDRMASLDLTTFPERLALAAAWLDRQAGAGRARPFGHVIVDEAQDLTPAHLQLLRALAAPGPDDLMLAEDSHQRIYGKKLTLSHYGIQVRGRSRRLTRNYRTTRQNLDAAFRILDPDSYEDMEGQPEEHRYLSPRNGPQPQLLPAADRAEELDRAAALLRRWLEEDEGLTEAAPETIAVLVRERNQRDAVVNGLAGRNLEVRAVDREAAGRGRPVVMTMHRAKGLEFRKVLLFDVSAASIPRSLRDQSYSPADRADAELRERSLLYVAATRARDQLAISWNGQASPLLEELLPQAT
ncbi:AAA family ATPase [Actinomyces bowdenii]|uniref:3'-5' exonuclease n=1 Tax=Actinomyces bowdenii TaxID=131109 RepID=UPI001ABC39C2|nr:3'-5' exonuclease [Actinomyces bowdenii]MBO3725848.1 AAA family ATPase [Actinomyces bowdenii]